jgi:amidohydrolase family protein
MKSAAFGMLVCSSFLWAGSGSQPSELVLTNVNVVDTRYGGIVPNTTVIVKDGLIEAVTKFALINLGPQLRVINAEGRYLIPGLWDMNVHLQPQASSTSRRNLVFARYLANGVTGVRDMDTLDRTTAGAGLQPEIEPAEPLWSLHRTSSRASLSLFERRSVEGLEEIRARCSVASSDIGAIGHDCDPSQARDLFLTLCETATWIVPALISATEPEDLHPDTSTANLVPLSQPRSDPVSFQELKVTAELQRDLDLVSEMRRVGVQFLAGTNGPRGGLIPGASLHNELELLVKSGFTPLQALQAATFNPALYMAKLDKFGVVERGHHADLVLLDENPLVDIRNTQKIFGLVLRGTYVSRQELQAMAARAEKNSDKHVNAANVVAPTPAE